MLDHEFMSHLALFLVLKVKCMYSLTRLAGFEIESLKDSEGFRLRLDSLPIACLPRGTQQLEEQG